MFQTFYYLTVLWGWSPESSKRARAPREPRRGQSSTISCTLALAWVPGPTSVRTRIWHVGAPSLTPLTLKKAAKTVESYGWYSGLCLGATVGHVWTARLYYKN